LREYCGGWFFCLAKMSPSILYCVKVSGSLLQAGGHRTRTYNASQVSSRGLIILDAHIVCPASELTRRTFPHCSIIAALKDRLMVVINRSNRVARAAAMPLRWDIVIGPPTLGGRRIHDGSEGRQRYLRLALKENNVQSGSTYIPATAPQGGWRDNSCERL
jgi:hypothetical protein